MLFREQYLPSVSPVFPASEALKLLCSLRQLCQSWTKNTFRKCLFINLGLMCQVRLTCPDPSFWRPRLNDVSESPFFASMTQQQRWVSPLLYSGRKISNTSMSGEPRCQLPKDSLASCTFVLTDLLMVPYLTVSGFPVDKTYGPTPKFKKKKNWSLFPPIKRDNTCVIQTACPSTALCGWQREKMPLWAGRLYCFIPFFLAPCRIVLFL